MDGVQLPQGYSHFEEAVYFLPFSSQKFLAFNCMSQEVVSLIIHQGFNNYVT